MRVHKGLIGGSAALAVVGLALRLLGVSWGTDLLVLAVLCAVAAQLYSQRTAQNQLSTTRRNLTQRIRELAELQAVQSERIEELTTLERTTLWYSKQRSRGGGKAPAERVPEARSRRSGRAGRASTPEVSNAAAGMSFVGTLDPSRSARLAGVLAPRTRAALPKGVEITEFMPGHAEESFDTGVLPDVIVIDEAALAIAPWDRATGPIGIAMMRDLLTVIRVAHGSGVATLIIPDALVPDIHSQALTASPALRLPLTPDVREQSAGARQSAILHALEDLARSERET